MHEAPNLLLLQGPEVSAEFPPSQLNFFFLMRGNDQRLYGATSGTVGEMMYCSNRKVTVTLALWALLSFGINVFFQAQLMTSHFESCQTASWLMRPIH